MAKTIDNIGVPLWNAIRNRLDGSLPSWRETVERFGQVAAVERRKAGFSWSDDEIFEALLRAVLSNNTDWAKVERVLSELRDQFSGFNLKRFAEATEDDVKRHVSWFQHLKAGSMTLRQSLIGLTKTSQLLCEWSVRHGSAEHYFIEVIETCGDPKIAAVALGKPGSVKKLPALGVPIAAETLRNMGYDICKPDRHLCRAVGSFDLVGFSKWPDKSKRRAPAATEAEMLGTMIAVESLSMLVKESVAHIDNAIWLLCAQMGLSMSNAELASLASQELHVGAADTDAE